MPSGPDAAPRIVILGGGGRVGRLLTRSLRNGAARIAVQSRRRGAGIDLVASPEAAELVAWLRQTAPDLVVVLWGTTSGSAEALRMNRALGCAAFEAAAKAGCRSVALMSSAAVYGPGNGTPFSETDPMAATAPYGAAKRDMEQAVFALRAALGPAAPTLSLLRLANVVGADMLGIAAETARADSPLILDRFSDGHGPRRSYLSPETLARTCLALAAASPVTGSEVLNVADGPDPVAMDALLLARAGLGAPVPWRWRPAPATALRVHALSTARLGERFPAVAAGFRRDAEALAADWVKLAEAPA